MPIRKKPTPRKKTEKTEDKDWQKWYAELDKKEHEIRLKQLGLEDDEIDEWEEMQEKGVTLDDLEVATTAKEEPEKKPKKK
ncbi:MAG: hypothetical protein V1672_05705 [Candidatus Diapherotrites archaeon]